MSSEKRQECGLQVLEQTRVVACECAKCGLSATRKSVVFGCGDPTSKLMFIGEGPGAEEDEQGEPFVGRAGQLLNQILEAAGIDRREIYITNIVKCRPPGNRNPEVEEMMCCDPYLQLQIGVIKPRLLVLLGNVATKWMLKTTEGISKYRGRWFPLRDMEVMPMFHPSYLLRYAGTSKAGSPKHLAWIDIQEVKRRFDEIREGA